MAARKNRTTLNDKWREKIRITAIINRLMDHVQGKNEMTATQINAAKILLAKVAPDLRQTDLELTGKGGGPIESVVKFVIKGYKPDEGN